ncbi:hypothetical protein IC006_2382 [Sulfuracidifex tepidarius]|uniref:HD domain-containing protein n=1 Tax=Sulfuracidifex tepidarius TaxID=1294262 RepID=A0A510DXX7_9CREN|nr:HD domain-containing protein [Sulfuracidifex tepidarius]BBG25047.1 hypothetical protein IC006_2382 [Sulfuracidifex tepidarius]
MSDVKTVKYIRDPIHGIVRIDKDLIDNPFFQRLRYVVQNGMAYMVFPSMRHSRFEHSLGTYHVASMMLDKVHGLSLGNDEKERVKRLALYHDIGHFPFSHTFEYAAKVLEYLNPGVYHTLVSLVGQREKLQTKLHEVMGMRILRELGEKELSDFMSKVYSKSEPKDDLTKVGKLIVNSDLDADRLDYLQRDSYYSGAKFGLIDPERLINTMDVTVNADSITGYMFPSKAIDDLEHFFLARFHMYSSVYNHPVIEIYNTVMAYFIAFALSKSWLTLPSDLKDFLNFTDDSVTHVLRGMRGDKDFSHFYHALVCRRRYKRASLEGSQARYFMKAIAQKGHEKELYQRLLEFKGKVVLDYVEIKTETGNILIKRSFGKKEAPRSLSDEESVVIPPERDKVYIGTYDDESAHEISEYFKEEFDVVLRFKS